MKKYVWVFFLLLFLNSCKQNPILLHRIEGKQIPVNEKIQADNYADSLISPYKERIDVEMNKVLAYSPSDYYKSEDKAETSIGNFMADLCYHQGNTIFNKKTKKQIDFVLLNFGGIRAGIPKGDITTRTAFELMPFENSMVVVELSYEKISKLLEYLAKSEKAHPISKQLKLNTLNGDIKSATLRNKPFDKSKSFHVLTSDYLQHGGDRMNFFKEPLQLYNLDYKIRDAILAEFEVMDTLRTQEDGRMQFRK